MSKEDNWRLCALQLARKILDLGRAPTEDECRTMRSMLYGYDPCAGDWQDMARLHPDIMPPFTDEIADAERKIREAMVNAEQARIAAIEAREAARSDR